MHHSWKSELLKLTAITSFCLVIGLIIGPVAWVLCIGLAGYIAGMLLQLKRLDQWVVNPRGEPPDLSGIPGSIAYRVYRLQQRSRSRKKRITRMLKKFRRSTRALPDATILLNNRDEIEWFNQAATQLLGLINKDLQQPITRLVRTPEFVEYMENQQYKKDPLEIPSPVDESRYLDIRVMPSGPDQKLLLVRDISHLQKLMNMRRDFVANVSHELRTPLTVVLGYLETLQDLPDLTVEEMTELAAKMNGPANRMKSLVEDLLLLSQLDTGSIPSAEQCPVIEVPAILKTLLKELEHLSKGKRSYRIDIDSGLRLRGIEKELYSVFSNLLSNAQRYTRDGDTIEVLWKLDSEQALFSVSDTGPGIPSEHLPRLTERFYRVDVGRSREQGGTGLGLSIVKQVLRRHEATFAIESKLGQGSCFSCSFPLHRVLTRDQWKPQQENAKVVKIA